MATIPIAAPFTGWDWDIVQDADWNDALPQILDGDGDPINLENKALDLWVRPTFDHAVLLDKLSTATGEIVLDDGPHGLASISYLRADVIANLPVGAWNFFLVLRDNAINDEIARGVLRVHPGKI